MTTQSSRTIYAVLAFIFFRIFDIWKPFPISYFDKNFKNGFGIVLDDLIAGVLAIIPAMFLIYLGFL
jgi:phosphatidylglycerophosphatase A